MESARVFVLNHLVFEMLLIKNKRPKLSTQAHPICAKVLI